MDLRNKINNYFKRKILPSNAKLYFSQLGEDILVRDILKWLNIDNPTYLDIGAYHPTLLSNTYLLYLNGNKGVCIEPDPISYEEIKRHRKNDITLNVGIGRNTGKMPFYVMSNKTLNTFSKEEATNNEKLNRCQIEHVIEIDILTINEIIEKYFNVTPHFISIDVEGLQEEVIYSLDFTKYSPEVLCIETKDENHNKISEIFKFMEDKGYFACADTYINTIFVQKNSWNNRKW